MKRFIKVKNGKVVDTSLLLQHVECYDTDIDEDGVKRLFVEQIDGSRYYLGIVVSESDDYRTL